MPPSLPPLASKIINMWVLSGHKRDAVPNAGGKLSKTGDVHGSFLPCVSVLCTYRLHSSPVTGLCDYSSMIYSL